MIFILVGIMGLMAEWGRPKDKWSIMSIIVDLFIIVHGLTEVFVA